jgi:hypothetical protein
VIITISQNKNKQCINDIETWQADFRKRIDQGLGHLEYLTEELDEEEYEEVELLNDFKQVISALQDALAGDLLEEAELELENLPLVEPEESQIQVQSAVAIEATDSLVEKTEELDDLTEAEEQYESLKSIAERWQEYENLNDEIQSLESLTDDVDTALSAFNEARKEVIGEIYEEITDRVERYYTAIHPDESGTGASIEVTNTGADLKKEFYDAGEYPPHSVFSEGHLDSLGLCLHLALTDYLQHDEKSLLLLDDVVMSVDQDHRLEIARMIADEFAEEYQIIITTHDELWAEQLRSQGALHGGSTVHFREWSFEGGVKESRRSIDVFDQWETVDEAVDDDELERAAHELRYATERMLQQTAISIGAKVEYDPRLRHTLGDFKDAVSGRLNTLTGKAKANLDTDTEMFEEADTLDDEYGSSLHDVGQKLKKVNRRVHWTPGKWLTLSPDEFEEVFEAHKAAFELLYCDNCGSSIRYEKFDDYRELRCNCREHYDIRWN